MRVLAFSAPKGLTRAKMAALCGVEPSTFGRWMANEAKVPLYAAEILAGAFGVPLDELRTIPHARRVAQ
jgi:transcriptional regulator with XRE-family HTH domain